MEQVFQEVCREVKRSAWERPWKRLWNGGCREAAGGIGSFSFDSVFFVDTKKMNPAGGPEPAGLNFIIYANNQVRGVAAPHAAILFWNAPKEYAEKRTRPPCPLVRVPSASGLQGALAKLGLRPQTFLASFALNPFRFGCVPRGN